MRKFKHYIIPILLSVLLLTVPLWAQSWQKPYRGIQINKTHPLAHSLIGAWVLNEGAGNTWNDSSGYGNNATRYGTHSTWTIGEKGICQDFDGDFIDYFAIPTQTFLSTSKWTITFQAQGDGDAAEVVLFGDGTANNFIGLYEGNQFRFRNSAGTIYDFTGITSFTKWAVYTLAATGTGRLLLYKDGVLIEDKSAVTSFVLNKLGSGYNSHTNTFDGRLGTIYLHNRTLLANDATCLHREPYAMFEPPRSAGIFGFATAGGTVFMHPIRRFLGDGY